MIGMVNYSGRLRFSIKRLLSHNRVLFDWAKGSEIYARYVFGTVHDKDYLFFRNFEEAGDVHLADIGANCGQSALSVAAVNKYIRIISFEPNKSLEKSLRFVKRLLGKRFSYHMFGIGKVSGEGTFFVPHVKDLYFSQEGSFHRAVLLENQARERIGRDFDISVFNYIVKQFDELGLSPAFIKIDTQGSELDVINGMRATLNRCHPILMIEMPADASELEQFRVKLAEVDYEIYYYDNIRNILFQTANWQCRNFFGLPRNGTDNTVIDKIVQQLVSVRA